MQAYPLLLGKGQCILPAGHLGYLLVLQACQLPAAHCQQAQHAAHQAAGRQGLGLRGSGGKEDTRDSEKATQSPAQPEGTWQSNAAAAAGAYRHRKQPKAGPGVYSLLHQLLGCACSRDKSRGDLLSGRAGAAGTACCAALATALCDVGIALWHFSLSPVRTEVVRREAQQRA